MTTTTDDPEPAPDDAELAPRARPGYRSRREGLDMTQKAALVAALVRVLAGLGGLGGTLLWLPITIATPVLAGVSTLMMVTGCLSVSKASRAVYPKLARIVAAACAAGALVVVALTATLGAGAFGPVRNAAPAPVGAPTVTFEPPPGR
ncbi:MAG: hypothetical protein HYS27_10240 [Deltaproteobacteria bacterium]|nr:hypothetical protein [Deltaproteobacteria bacterium]